MISNAQRTLYFECTPSSRNALPLRGLVGGWRTALARGDGYAAAVLGAGVRPGDRVAVWSVPRIDALLLYFVAPQIGQIAFGGSNAVGFQRIPAEIRRDTVGMNAAGNRQGCTADDRLINQRQHLIGGRDVVELPAPGFATSPTRRT
ncbi:MAG: hypothetical protein E2O58_12320 [Gammaproteobacteria bacterium]|nr:MAG: hypothetical protein E2O58_12320 [Gammaproteobacteria bacterium]